MEAPVDGIDGMAAEKVVAEIYRQLISEFQPATKLVAECGKNLLQAFQNLTKQCDAYIQVVEKLARTGERAFQEGKRKAAELELIVATMKSINEKHKENVDKFKALTEKTAEYSRDEKEKLKHMSHGYENREKAIKKSISKRQQDPIDLQKFYSNEMDLALRQQSQRYRFTADKHNEWLKSYIELLQFTNQLIGGNDNNAQHPTTVHQQSPEAKRSGPPERSEAVAPPPVEDIPRVVEDSTPLSDELEKESKDDDSSKPTASKIDEAFGWIHEDQKEDKPKLQDAATMCNEDMGSIQGVDSELENFVLGSPGGLVNRRYSKPPPLPKRTHASPPRADYSDQEDFYEPGARKQANVRKDEDYSHYKYEAPIPQRGYEKMPPKAWIANPSYDARPASVADMQAPVPPTRTGYGEKPPVAVRAESRRPLSQANGILFNPKNINAVPTAIIPPPFGAADYGKLLVCVHNFHGQTANQLSLNMGDRIVLIKSGSKGWIFAKHIETQRTGWFPSRFVQLLPDVSEETPA